MPRQCTVCAHRYRDVIDEGLACGRPLATLAVEYEVGESALWRHRQSHLSPALVDVHRRREDIRHVGLLDRLEELYAKTRGILDTAEQAGKSTLALSAVRELRALLELLGKATGELREQPQVVNVVASAEWRTLRAALLEVLAAFPDAKAAVAARMLEVEDGAGQ